MKKETRGRKPIPDEQKKVPLTIFIRQHEIDKAGGKKATQDKLYQLFKSHYEQSNQTTTL